MRQSVPHTSKRTRALLTMVAMLIGTDALLSQQVDSLNMEFLGNMNKYPLSSVISYSACWGYVAPNGREYALLGVNTGTSIVDITDAPNLQEVAFIPGPSNPIREMKTYGEYAYVICESSDTADGAGVQIIDMRNLPVSASLVNTYVWVDTVNGSLVSHPRVHTVSVSGKYLYLNGGTVGGVRILDLADPAKPVKAGRYVSGYVHDSYIENDTIYAATISADGVEIVDARNKANPQLITRIQYPGSGTHNTWTFKNGAYLVTTDEVGQTTKSLKVWDIRNLNSPSMVGEVNYPDAVVHNAFMLGDFAYVAWYSRGLRVIDLSNPAKPVEVGYYDTYPGTPPHDFVGAWGAFPYYPSGKVVVSDRETGLYVFRYIGHNNPPPPPPVPTEFTLHQNYPNPFNPVTTIQFDLPVDTFVNLRLLNLLGQEVRLLRHGFFPAGTYTVQVNAQGLSSGIYMYSLETSEFTESRKMIVIR